MTCGQSKRLAKRDVSRASGSSSIIQMDRFSDWDKENVNIAGQVAISAPVPVWCTSLGKDALKTILAMSEEGMHPEEFKYLRLMAIRKTKTPWSRN